MKFEHDFAKAYFKNRSHYSILLEVVCLNLVVFSIAYYLNPLQPFNLLSGKFPFAIFIPVFCSLFYGTTFGFISFGILMSAISITTSPELLKTNTIYSYLAGGFGLTTIVGLFSGYWHKNIKTTEHLNHYLREHLESLSKDYYLLKLSHEKLEHSYITKPLSFREALLTLKSKLIESDYKLTKELAEEFMTIISQFCLLSQVGFFLSDDDETYKPLTFLGKEFKFIQEDPLVKESISNKSCNFIAPDLISLKNKSDYLIVMPLVKTDGKIIALVVVKDMPFWSVTEENVTSLNVFAEVLMLDSQTSATLKQIRKEFPNIENNFLQEFYALDKLYKAHKIDSIFAALYIPDIKEKDEIIYRIMQSKRALDTFAIYSLKKGKIIFFLLALTKLPGALGFKNRMFNLIRSDFGTQVANKGLLFHYKMLDENKFSTQLYELTEDMTDEFTGND